MDNKASTKKMILDALDEETTGANSIGIPDSPTVPLFGSLNVPVSNMEKKKDE